MATWLEDIIIALENLRGIAHYSDLYKEVESIRKSPLPKSWMAIIRREIETHSSSSSIFNGKDDFFFSVEGLGNGVWGLRKYLEDTPLASDIEESIQNDESKGHHHPERTESKTYRILRDTKLARQLKLLHQNSCQLCGHQIKLTNGTFYSEAHHIKPLGRPHNGPDIAGNILVLCPNHHVQLDYGVLPLNIENLRQHPRHNIQAEFINYHNNYFGLA